MNSIELEKIIIGMSLDDAKKLASSNGFYLRILWQDGTIFYGTCDMDDRRIDVYIKNNIIINHKDRYDESAY